MNKMYCFSCGAVISYKAEKPSFCQSCGLAIGSKSKAPIGNETEEIEDEFDEDYIQWSKDQFSQNSLDIEIDINKQGVETFGTMAAVEGYVPLGKRDVKGKSKEDILREFQREAGLKEQKGKTSPKENKGPKGLKGKGTPKKQTRKRRPKKT